MRFSWVIYDRTWRDYADRRVYHYVGQTHNLNRRRKAHLKMFGFTCRVAVLERFQGSQGKADKRERFWVRKLRARFGSRLENRTNGGQRWPADFAGIHRTEESRRKISKIMRRVYADPEVRRRLSRALSQAWADPKVHKERCKALRRAGKDPEVRRRRSLAQRKHRGTIQSRQHQSLLSKRMWEDPERRKEYSEMTKLAWANPKIRRRWQLAIKQGWVGRKARA